MHSSAANETSDPRWAFLCTFDTLSNAEGGGDYGRHYRRTAVWGDEHVLECGARQLQEIQAKLRENSSRL